MKSLDHPAVLVQLHGKRGLRLAQIGVLQLHLLPPSHLG
jgi:hypothetical protein